MFKESQPIIVGKELPKQEVKSNLETINGVIILDLDGTLTVPGSKYAVDKRTLGDVSEFVLNGGICALNTGATKERAERTFLHPIFCLLDEQCGFDKASEIFSKKMWLLPENGSSILKSKGVTVMENELWFLWDEHNPLHLPNKENVRNLIETILVPKIPGSFVIGDKPGEVGRRNYILSWKGLKNVPDLIEMIRNEVIPQTDKIINWSEIEMKAARTTIDFINAKSGKEPSTRKFLSMIDCSGPIVGFGDLGDEFARDHRVLTFNVNAQKPNSFRMAGVPSMEVSRWRSVCVNDCFISSDDKVFFNEKEIQVLRDKEGKIFLSNFDQDGKATDKENILVIDPLTKGAGEATAEMLERLMKIGYFDK